MSSKKRSGLLLTLGGAPSTFHTIPGLPGYFHPTIAHLVGEDCDLSLEAAKEAEKAHELKLTELSDKAVEEAQQAHADQLAAARPALREARRSRPVGAEVDQINDEQAALKGAS